VSEIKLVFGIPPERPAPNFPPTWNGAPTDHLPIVRFDAKAGERSLDLARWGLVPYWAKDIKVGFANIKRQGRGHRDAAGVPADSDRSRDPDPTRGIDPYQPFPVHRNGWWAGQGSGHLCQVSANRRLTPAT
jgi:hypothetical protein